jgi:phage-related protein
MENITDFYRQVNETEAEIKAKVGSPLFVCSLDSRKLGTIGGRIFEVDTRRAALDIVNGTHRVASEQEIAQYKEELESRRQAIHNEEYQRKQQFALPPELAGLVELALAKTKPSAKEK